MLDNFKGYIKKGWKNAPDKSTPLSADNLDYMDSGIKNNADAIKEIAGAVSQKLENNSEKIPTMNLLFEVNKNATDIANEAKGVAESAIGNFSDKYVKKTYKKGETCIQDNVLYEANADINPAEDWNAAHWTETSVEKIRAKMRQELDVVNANIANITPDDTAVDGKPWTSKNIVDMLCPPLEVSGNPVQCYPVPGYPLGITANWEPTQEGTGDPSPDNIRPIKGRDSVTVIRCGQNLYGGKPLKNIAWANDYRDLVDFLNLLPIGAYMLRLTFRLDRFNSRYTSDTEEASALQVVIKRKDDHTIANNKAEMVTTKTVLPLEKNIALELNITSDDVGRFDHVYCYACGRHTAAEGAPNGALGWGTIYNVSISIGSVAPEYTPYQGDTIALALPETIYGGSVDAVTGEGEKEWGSITLDGSEKWYEYKNNTGYAAQLLETDYSYNEERICSHYKKSDFIVGADNALVYFLDVAVDVDKNTISAWKAYLATQYAAGTPVRIAYKLAMPESFQTDGGSIVPALDGINTILTDNDSVTVTARKDPVHLFDTLKG